MNSTFSRCCCLPGMKREHVSLTPPSPILFRVTMANEKKNLFSIFCWQFHVLPYQNKTGSQNRSSHKYVKLVLCMITIGSQMKSELKSSFGREKCVKRTLWKHTTWWDVTRWLELVIAVTTIKSFSGEHENSFEAACGFLLMMFSEKDSRKFPHIVNFCGCLRNCHLPRNADKSK